MKKILLAMTLMFLMSVGVAEAKGKPLDSCKTIKSGEIESSTGDIINSGFDQWGYNYQAHMFNGFYDNYSRPDALVSEGSRLQMKWSDSWLSNKDCTEDNKLDRHLGYNTYTGSGAWLTNHESGEYDGEWDMTGEWVLEFDYNNRLYIHDMIVENNTFTGVGGYPSEGPYSTSWTVEGVVSGDDVTMRINYDNSSYFVDIVGTIDNDGMMSGTWSNFSQSGDWKSTSGMATREVCEWDYFVKIVTPGADDNKVDGVWYNSNGDEIGPVIWGSFAIVQEVENNSCTEVEGVQYKSPLNPGLGFYSAD